MPKTLEQKRQVLVRDLKKAIEHVEYQIKHPIPMTTGAPKAAAAYNAMLEPELEKLKASLAKWESLKYGGGKTRRRRGGGTRKTRCA